MSVTAENVTSRNRVSFSFLLSFSGEKDSEKMSEEQDSKRMREIYCLLHTKERNKRPPNACCFAIACERLIFLPSFRPLFDAVK